MGFTADTIIHCTRLLLSGFSMAVSYTGRDMSVDRLNERKARVARASVIALASVLVAALSHLIAGGNSPTIFALLASTIIAIPLTLFLTHRRFGVTGMFTAVDHAGTLSLALRLLGHELWWPGRAASRTRRTLRHGADLRAGTARKRWPDAGHVALTRGRSPHHCLAHSPR